MSALTNEAREWLRVILTQPWERMPGDAVRVQACDLRALLADSDALAKAEAVLEVEQRGHKHYRSKAVQFQEERDALRAELDTLKAKPRFRTRKVTAKDVGAGEEEWCKDSYGAGERHKAMNALGFRRRVDGDS